jgi:CubicO group peptidase (beta-lactamase class C family)
MKTHISNISFFSFTGFISIMILMIGFLLNCSGEANGPVVEGPKVKISPDSMMPSEGLVHVAPEDVGWSSEELEHARQFAQEIGAAAVMALYDGKVFLSWGAVARDYACHSIRKPLLNALCGIHVERGNIDPDMTLESMNIDDLPPSLTDDEKQAKVRDLLKSRSGVYHEAAEESQSMKDLRPERDSHPPDTYFYYNNWDFNALGTIFERETGTTIFEEFKAEVADPIGMQDFKVEDCSYRHELDKSVHPVYHFRMSARDMARFGLLYLRNGNWEGRQIISRQWIYESTTAYSYFESSEIGYGYLWKILPEDYEFGAGFCYTDNAVQQLVVLPEEKLVYVFRMNTEGDYTDPGKEALEELFSMIMDARIEA